jgi:hypothetical protein
VITFRQLLTILKNNKEMRTLFICLAVILINSTSFGQKILSGEYDGGLKLAFDKKTGQLTGYFENYTGWDERTNNPSFSCIFYLRGVVKGNIFKITTYYPADKSGDSIEGTFESITDTTIAIKLPEEHGGCWNVQHFADEPVKFELAKTIGWIQISYVTAEKTFFYSEKSPDKKQKAYLVKNDFVCIDKLDGAWAYCTFYGKKTTKGWMRVADLE